MEHEAETERQRRIRQLTLDYATPPDAGDDYAQLMGRLRDFALDLGEHVHIENDLIFPNFERLEETWILR
jgi:regulator of cell morphogenesis and NO signaling